MKHSKMKTVGCNGCNRKFYTQFHLESHVCRQDEIAKSPESLKDNGGRRLCCRCKTGLPMDESLESKIGKDDSLLCQTCLDAFSRQAEDPDPAVECHLCDETYQLLAELRIHLKAQHDFDGPSKPYSCRLCRKRFSLKIAFRKHARAQCYKTIYGRILRIFVIS